MLKNSSEEFGPIKPSYEEVEATVNPDLDADEIERYQEGVISIIERALGNKEGFLGKGQTAVVYMGADNPNVCYKVFVNDTSKDHFTEADIQDDVWRLNGGVGIPKVYLSERIHRGPVTKSNTSLPAELKIICMERLDAVSIEDVLKGKASLPESMTIESLNRFFDDLESFLKKLHDEHNIFHRDIHWGNIMIGNQDSKPYLIDFGNSAKAFSEEEAYQNMNVINGKSVTMYYADDLKQLFEVKKKLREYLLTNNKK